MTLDEAKRRIFDRLCQELQEPGSDGWMPIEKFHAHASVPLDLYHKALAEIRDSHIETSDSTREIRLDASSREACKQGRKPF